MRLIIKQIGVVVSEGQLSLAGPFFPACCGGVRAKEMKHECRGGLLQKETGMVGPTGSMGQAALGPKRAGRRL